MRMRRRRVERCMLRAEVALEAGAEDRDLRSIRVWGSNRIAAWILRHLLSLRGPAASIGTLGAVMNAHGQHELESLFASLGERFSDCVACGCVDLLFGLEEDGVAPFR